MSALALPPPWPERIAWSKWVRVDSVMTGVSTIVAEVVIIAELAPQGRLLYYYHPIPMVAAAAILATVVYPTDLYLNMLSTLLNLAIAFNMYNTFLVHVVALGDFVEPPIDGTLSMQDVFLPRYRAGFAPWGPLLQVGWSLLTVSRISFRCLHVAHLIDERLVALARAIGVRP
jgi:hypothetical protein